MGFKVANFEVLKKKLEEVNLLKSTCHEQDFPALFADILFKICKLCVPTKKVPTRKPKAVKSLRRKKRKLQIHLDAILSHAHPDNKRINELKDGIVTLCFEIKE